MSYTVRVVGPASQRTTAAMSLFAVILTPLFCAKLPRMVVVVISCLKTANIQTSRRRVASRKEPTLS